MPYQEIQTYLTIVDDIGNHKSLFKAEAARAQELLQTVANLPRGAHALIALDEMFCGTSPRVGQAIAYALTDLLHHHINTTGLIATHFTKLTEIAAHYPALYRNGHFKAFKQPDGSFYYPYTLHEGPSSQMIALDLLAHEGFDRQLLNYAYAHFNHLTSA
jgi:DNA mismatch repair ATPase MutS